MIKTFLLALCPSSSLPHVLSRNVLFIKPSPWQRGGGIPPLPGAMVSPLMNDWVLTLPATQVGSPGL
ncbi:hypothetical protein [Spirosoma utsteinense]|uniref:Secreted protein n=1 Tax=Spirosoma utsteinense TaxID=2585773 RepID=A0ABR6WGR0_9BACT|nr:hypothetical protein [Spirosoma utsteinense]MBC3795280.1 hypothetical protein [Spirosoma utsteinense]